MSIGKEARLSSIAAAQSSLACMDSEAEPDEASFADEAGDEEEEEEERTTVGWEDEELSPYVSEDDEGAGYASDTDGVIFRKHLTKLQRPRRRFELPNVVELELESVSSSSDDGTLSDSS